MNYLLFTTTRCPKCPAFRAYVEENLDMEGEVIDENIPDFGKRIADSHVANAPTILIYDGDEEVFRTSEVGELEEFLRDN